MEKWPGRWKKSWRRFLKRAAIRFRKPGSSRAAEIRRLRALRALTEMSQKDMALALGVKPRSVCKMEKQADLHISTLRRFVEAAGGRLELRVVLPDLEPIQLTHIGDLAP